ncbi:CpsD/CapB family tyrosine-protein kinase [Jeotgalibacillus haloalkalitolerans]|uniref:non-specific protein-tyrosine kinase n=1 Tax=Jeotgalibacillus haloalkalitolerans TaxID=3104292 RepID=A0ABU5KJ71_9BACL|nr:CpsD/CapB family tyrosine-protein kinase [Jeotgalibacillus sp. HH7-29]MDZ5711305.1 CpsD/CapB family tyrosine-protein kinase [Jeotgalibacillus sp. HH7-29]
MAAKKNKGSNQHMRNLIAHANPKAVAAEQYRTIRTNIQFSAVDQEIQTIVVTSSGAGEGKSTTAANMAIVFAQAGKRTLLVDADMRKPTVHYTFSLINSRGLSNILTRQNRLEEVVEESGIEKLQVLTSGIIPPNPSELLDSRSMDQFIQQARESYDVVIFDAPPVLAVTDAQVLASRCDGTILVVRSRVADKEKAVKAKEQLLAVKTKILGVILNDKKVEAGDDYYYYYGE